MLLVTILLGASFVALQTHEYFHVYHDLSLTLLSGVYGSTFYPLSGFHGLPITRGVVMLVAILGGALKGHFNPAEHFGFEAMSWHWHFSTWCGWRSNSSFTHGESSQQVVCRSRGSGVRTAHAKGKPQQREQTDR